MKRQMIVSMAVLVLGGLILAVALLPGSTPAAAQDEAPAGREMVLAVSQTINGESFSGEVRVTFADAAELPDRPAEASGLFVARDGDLVTLGTGTIDVEVDAEVFNDEEPVTTITANYDGDEVAVRLTPETIFYRDTTERPEIGPAEIEAGELQLQRTMVPGSAAELGENMIVRAWGALEDGVLVAETLVYEPIQ